MVCTGFCFFSFGFCGDCGGFGDLNSISNACMHYSEFLVNLLEIDLVYVQLIGEHRSIIYWLKCLNELRGLDSGKN